MGALNSQQNENRDIDFIKDKVKENRNETQEVIETLFYVAMKSYQEVFVIADEYNIAEHPFKSDVYEGGNTIEECLSNLYDKVKQRHQETFKVKSLFESDLKETMHHPINYIKGYAIFNGSLIKEFTIFAPRSKTRMEWVKDGLFSKKEIQVENEINENEIDLSDLYYQYSVNNKELTSRELLDAKSLVVKATHRNFSLSDEMFAYRKLERMWDEWMKAGEADVESFEEFLKALHHFKESASPEIQPLLESFSRNVGSKKSVINQYELIRKYEAPSPIYFD